MHLVWFVLTNITEAGIARGEFTSLALYLDAAMARDESARARYLAIYGEEWYPLTSVDLSDNSTAPTTTATTVAR